MTEQTQLDRIEAMLDRICHHLFGAAPAKRPTMTTGQVAKLLGISTRQVCTYIEAGDLVSTRLPGMLKHAITLDSVEAFMAKQGKEMT
ncbi:MAG: hypothetical protein AMXMBFR84_26420 [Candidatus Hydrogenedentota bacterium]